MGKDNFMNPPYLSELEPSFKRINELTGKFPRLTKSEVKELKEISKGLSAECAEILYEWE